MRPGKATRPRRGPGMPGFVPLLGAQLRELLREETDPEALGLSLECGTCPEGARCPRLSTPEGLLCRLFHAYDGYLSENGLADSAALPTLTRAGPRRPSCRGRGFPGREAFRLRRFPELHPRAGGPGSRTGPDWSFRDGPEARHGTGRLCRRHRPARAHDGPHRSRPGPGPGGRRAVFRLRTGFGERPAGTRHRGPCPGPLERRGRPPGRIPVSRLGRDRRAGFPRRGRAFRFGLFPVPGPLLRTGRPPGGGDLPLGVRPGGARGRGVRVATPRNGRPPGRAVPWGKPSFPCGKPSRNPPREKPPGRPS